MKYSAFLSSPWTATRWILLTLVVLANCSSLVDASQLGESQNEANDQRSFQEDLHGVTLVTVLPASIANVRPAVVGSKKLSRGKPVPTPKLVRVEFKEDSIIGHADLVHPAWCLLVQVSDKQKHYGVYALWNEKSTLRMPFPNADSTISEKGTSAESMLVRLASGMGLSQQRAKQFIENRRDHWFGSGLRALVLGKLPEGKQSRLTIFCFEAERP